MPETPMDLDALAPFRERAEELLLRASGPDPNDTAGWPVIAAALAAAELEAAQAADDTWGPGPESSWRPAGTVRIGDQVVKLIHGARDHSKIGSDLYVDLGRGDDPVAFSGHRCQVRVEVVESNYLKMSHLSGDEVRKACDLRIAFDGEPVYHRFYRDAIRALREAPGIVEALMGHPLDLHRAGGRAAIVGRRVWYWNQPGVVTEWFGDQGTIIVEFDEDDYAARGAKAFTLPDYMSIGGAVRLDTSAKLDILQSEGAVSWFRDPYQACPNSDQDHGDRVPVCHLCGGHGFVVVQRDGTLARPEL